MMPVSDEFRELVRKGEGVEVLLLLGPPEGYTEIELGMSNFDHQVDEGFGAALQAGRVYGRHAAWNFNGLVWFANGVFHEQVWRYNQPVGTLHGETLEELMTTVNDVYGYE